MLMFHMHLESLILIKTQLYSYFTFIIIVADDQRTQGDPVGINNTYVHFFASTNVYI